MKVLEPGIQPKPWTSTESCKHCKAKLLVSEPDLFQVTTTDIRGESTKVAGFRCGYCFQDCTLADHLYTKVNKLPSRKRWQQRQDSSCEW